MKNNKVLVVDDEELMRKLVGTMVSALGYSHEVAEDGAIAYGKIRHAREIREPFGAIITDLRMPVRDGVRLYEDIRKDIKVLPVIFMTGYERPAELQAILKEDSHTSYIHKPFSLDSLDSALSKHLPLF